MTVKELLIAAKELISDPARWTKGAGARDAKGVSCNTDAPEAVCWCSAGAIYRTTLSGECLDEARRELSKAARKLAPELFGDQAFFTDYVGLNDAKETTHADVMKMFDTAIGAQP